ncbi:Outer membrane protein OprM [Chlamydiales bacterium STE3]|nr:Outer membrane protein OprM [Chlamydiales bacterium STE3]
MRKKFNQSIALVFLLLSLHSCVLYPRYQRTIDGLPESWRVESATTSIIANFNWWQQFDDPVLNVLICEALEYNKDLRIAIARVYEFYAAYGIAQSALLPELTGSGYFQRQELSLESLGANGLTPAQILRTYNTYNVFLNLNYELDFFGRIRSLTDAALHDYLSQIDARRSVILTLITSLAKAYIQLRQFDMQLQISQETYQSRLDSYELAVLRFEGGLTSEIEVKQAQSEVDVALTQVKQLEIQIPQQENLISILVGKNPQSITRGRTLDSLALPGTIPAGIPSEILEQRPDIMQAEQQLLAANARIGEARAQFFPLLKLTGSYGSISLELSKLFTDGAAQWNYMLSFLQPLFNANRLTYQVDAAEMRKLQALYRYQQTVQNAFREVNDTLIAHKKTIELIAVQKHRAQVLKEYLDLAKLQYDNGQTDYLNVLDAERNLFSAELDLAQVQSDGLITFINVYGALGGGWVIAADQVKISSP